MTPRPLDVESVESKLELMTPLIEHLASVGTPTAEDLEADLPRRLAVERALQVLVDIAVSINSHLVVARGGLTPADYRQSFAAAADADVITRELAERLAPSAGMRNVLTHRYGDVDLTKVSAAVPRARDDYREYVQQISRWLLNRWAGDDPPGP